PIVDQIRHRPGNLSILVHYFTNTPSTEPTVGLRGAVPFVVRHLDVFHLSIDQLAHPGLLVANDPHRNVNVWRGLVLLLVWAVAAVVALRLRERALLALHVVAGAGLVLAVLATSHIYGIVWYYLLLSIWTVAGVMVIATVWTAAVVARRRMPSDRPAARARAGSAPPWALAG